MNDLLTWAPLIVAGCVLWAGNHVGQMIHAANMDRREDHREMLAALEDLAGDLGKIELMIDGLSARYDPPDLSDYD